MKALLSMTTKTAMGYGKGLFACGIVGAAVFLFSSGELAAETPGLGAGLPDELGRFNVGHTAIDIVGVGSLGETRPIKAEVWYPAAKQSWDMASPSEYAFLLKGVTLVPSKWDPLSWSMVSDVAREGADFDMHGPFPVVVFSHGSGNSPIDYARTLEHLASHGYVVAAPRHNGDSQDDGYTDFINTTNGSKVLDCLDHLARPCVDTVGKNVADRALDISKLLDTLPVAFGDNVDMNQVFAMGHSRGAISALAAAGGSSFFHVTADPRVKAVLGFAIGQPAVTFNLNLQAITVPTVLVAGDLDFSTPKEISETAFGMISSQDKAFLVIKNTVHRHFYANFCDEMQAAGAVVLSKPTRAILDKRTLLIALQIPNQARAVDVCAFDSFINPVDIRPLVLSLNGYAVTPDNVPTTGMDTREVHRLMSEIAVTFFDSVGKALRHEDQPCEDGVCADTKFNRFLSENFLLKKETDISTAVILTDEDMKQLDCREDCPD